MAIPKDIWKWNRSMRGAYMKGRLAAQEGGTEDDCPYADHRKPSGRISWSRAFINAWMDGFRDAVREREGC
jgi:hypothetical protein